VRILPAEKLKAELSVHEDDGIACFKKVSSGCYASRAMYSLLCDALEEEIKGLDEPLLGPRRRSRNEAPILT